MIIGLGLDVVDVSRMRRWEGIPGIFERFFHPAEIIDSRSRGTAATLSLAARFAAKEAFGKALGTGLRGMALRDIRVVNDAQGKPEIETYNGAAAALRRRGALRVHVSLAHEKESAIAVVVIEGGAHE